MDSPDDRVRLVQSESERLKQYLSSLPTDAWSRPSACDLWEVRDVVAHLAGDAAFYTRMVSRGSQGDSSPPEGYPPPGTADANSSSERIGQGAISDRERLGDRLLPSFNERNDQLNQLLSGLGPQGWDAPCYHPGGVFPARNFINMRMLELSMHGWDIRSSLEPSAHLSAESIPAIMDLIPGLFGWLFRPGSRLPAPVRYRFQLTGVASSDGVSDIVVEGDRARLEPAGESTANVAFRCDTETFVLLMLGRLTVDRAVATGRLAPEGDSGLVTEFGQWFKGA